MIEIEILNEFDKKYKYIENKEVIGFIEIHTLFENTDITNVFVEQKNRRKGIASKLLEYVINDNNEKIFMLEVKEDNNIAIKLYEKYNFIKISERKNYYKNKSAFIMRREVK